jgi:hypothetical protein
VTLVVRDSLGNRLPTGGLTITFELDTDGNTSDGTFGATADVGDGSYTATFTGTVSGTPRGVRARIGGVLVTTAIPTIEVTP